MPTTHFLPLRLVGKSLLTVELI